METPTAEYRALQSTTAIVPLPAVLRLLRPKQWVKNGFVLAGVLFGHALGDPDLLLKVAFAFIAFSLMGSSVYVLNDYMDRDADRNHPLKRHRPIASGSVTPTRNPRTAIGELLDHYILPRLRDRVLHDAGSVIVAKPNIDAETPKILAVLTEAHKTASDQGARFAIVYAPSVVVTDRQDWARAVAMLLEWAKQQNVAVIDLSAAYAAHAARDIYLDGIHLKPLGHALMEQAFLRYAVSTFRIASKPLP